MTLIHNPHNLVPSQEASRSTKTLPVNPKGEFDCNFTLYIALTKEAKANPKNFRYCRKAGKKVPVNGITFYSKFLGKIEPSPEKVLANFTRILRNWSAGSDMEHAIIYWNLNRGNRVKYHFEKLGQTERANVQNIELMRFDKRAKTCHSVAKMFSAPLIHTEEIGEEKLNAYYQNLMHYIPEDQALSIRDYLDFYYNPERSRSLYPVVISTEAPKTSYQEWLHDQNFNTEQELVTFCKKEKEADNNHYQLLLDFYKSYKDLYFHEPTTPQNEPSEVPAIQEPPTKAKETLAYIAKEQESLQNLSEKIAQVGKPQDHNPPPTKPTHKEATLLAYQELIEVMGLNPSEARTYMDTPAFQRIVENKLK